LTWPGYLGAHIAECCLRAGFRVRGTARSADKLDALARAWERAFGTGRFEAVAVEDITTADWASAVAGVAGVVHTAGPAGNVEVDPDAIVASNKAILDAARAAGVRRFVFTGSTQAVGIRQPGEAATFDDTMLIDVDAARARRAAMDDGFPKNLLGYALHKAESELLVRAAHGEMVTSTCTPNNVFGPALGPNASPTARVLQSVFDGDYAFAQRIPPQWCV